MKYKSLLLLHLLLMVYSTSGIFSKLASKTAFMSMTFCFYYGCIVVLLGVYAIVWQQIIRSMPLTTAFASKAVTVVWGIVWGIVFFGEKLTVGKAIGAGIVICGVILYVVSDLEDPNEQ